jgi:hypothetical protein
MVVQLTTSQVLNLYYISATVLLQLWYKVHLSNCFHVTQDERSQLRLQMFPLWIFTASWLLSNWQPAKFSTCVLPQQPFLCTAGLKNSPLQLFLCNSGLKNSPQQLFPCNTGSKKSAQMANVPTLDIYCQLMVVQLTTSKVLNLCYISATVPIQLWHKVHLSSCSHVTLD